MKLRSAVLTLLVGLALQASHVTAALAISNEAASHAVIQEVRNLADQVARALAARRFQNRTLVEILNEEWTRNLDSAVEQLRTDIPKFQEISKSSTPADLYAKSFPAKVEGFIDRTEGAFYFFSSMMALFGAGAMGVFHGDWSAGVALNPVLIAVIAGGQTFFIEHFKLHEKFFGFFKSRNGAFQKDLQQVFFARLDELKIDYDRRNPVEWLNLQLDGNPIPNWEILTTADKKKAIQSYVNYLESLSVAMGTNEDAVREIREVARSVQSHTDGKWWPYWGKSSVRKISKLLGDSFARMKELDQIYHFADHQSNALFDEKVFVDYPELFTERFRDYFLETRLDLPRDLLPSLNHLRELGGVIDVEINNRLLSKSEYLAGRALTQFRFTVSFPGKPDLKSIETILDFVYATTATDPQLLHRVEVPKERLAFGFKLEAAFKKSGFFVEVMSAHEQAFPEQHCGTALSVPATLPSIVEKAAAVGAGM